MSFSITSKKRLKNHFQDNKYMFNKSFPSPKITNKFDFENLYFVNGWLI